MPLSRRRLIVTAAAAALAPIPRAGAVPAGPVILSVRAPGLAAPATFDLAMLDALPQRVTTTATPWHEGRSAFSGPTIASVLDAVGAAGTTLRFIALNDYAAEMPASDVVAYPVILATRRDGRTMSVREKGPIFVIYPFDEFPQIYDEVHFGRSVWQLREIEVLG